MNQDHLYKPHLVFWEVTRVCNLGCMHCRASALHMKDSTDQCRTQTAQDLSTAESYKLIDEITSFSNPILVLSGGEPLLRKDIYDLAQYGTDKGLRVVMATNATLITEPVAHKLQSAGIQRISVSVYGTNEEKHDGFTGEKGAFVQTMQGMENIKKAGISLQINTTITKKNLDQIDPLINFSIKIGADAMHVFFLVPTGRGREIAGDEISGEEYEKSFEYIARISKTVPIHLKVTCAPHYYRVMRQQAAREGTTIEKKPHGFSAVTKGCLAGTGVCFVSYKGDVFPCGYFQQAAGNLRQESFDRIWHDASLFKDLRDDRKLKGKCGICEYKKICAGCRARAYEHTGDYMEEEPYCIYTPATKTNAVKHG